MAGGRLAQNGVQVNIRPGVSVLSLFRHLNYKPWYAMAEFVDNSIQSYTTNVKRLKAVDGPAYKLKIAIELDADGKRIVVRDNAAGIDSEDYQRAFKPAEPPPDTSGLAEFGVGMKSAACWFSRHWSVRTKALGETVEREISLDIEDIVRNSKEVLVPKVTTVKPKSHYTEVVLDQLHTPVRGRTLGKIKEHLASMYRQFLRTKSVEILFEGVPLSYTTPEILRVPFYKNDKGEARLWRKDIDVRVGDRIHVSGFAALRATGSISEAGFALFRRGRLIQGSGDEGYRPESVFGKSNSFSYQRLFGELTVEGAEVSHTKDGFRWNGDEELFLKKLKTVLDSDPIPLLQQAEGYRVRPKTIDVRPRAEAALRTTAKVVEQNVPAVLKPHLTEPPPETALPGELAKAKTAAIQPIVIDFHGEQWRIKAELTDDPGVGDWLGLSVKDDSHPKKGERIRELEIRLSLAHPFMVRFSGVFSEHLEGIVRIAMALALAEIAARESGVPLAGAIRKTVNDLLRHALSKP